MAVPQSRIVEETPSGFDHVVEVLGEMEASCLISRLWDPAAKELMVSA
jgi:hypothetical protein